MPLIEGALLIKGGMVLVKLLGPKIFVAAKVAVSTFGWGATIAGASTICLTAGVITWGYERVVQLQRLHKALAARDIATAAMEAAALVQAAASADGIESYSGILDEFLATDGLDVEVNTKLIEATGELIEAARSAHT